MRFHVLHHLGASLTAHGASRIPAEPCARHPRQQVGELHRRIVPARATQGDRRLTLGSSACNGDLPFDTSSTLRTWLNGAGSANL